MEEQVSVALLTATPGHQGTWAEKLNDVPCERSTGTKATA